jgi:hypothetical protein
MRSADSPRRRGREGGLRAPEARTLTSFARKDTMQERSFAAPAAQHTLVMHLLFIHDSYRGPHNPRTCNREDEARRYSNA